ncbi:MAG: MotA/TolQ/ExbB proton channel family protein, partial [Muribaculaceae bacterium]|nr:MotA/TolQ/ExbB proton channel family protein [Muribaculaceae bacterium]
MLLLDAALTGTPAAAQAAATAATQELSLWDLCLRGGPLMIPIALLSLVCVYVFVERALVIHRASREDATFMRRIRDYVHEGELESAHNLCKKNGSPYARLIDRGLSRIGRPVNDILAAVENTGNIEVATLSKGLPWLATTAAGAPMLGFLGTVVGMVQAFYDIASAGNSANIATFSSGIYTALVTTVAGLVVGVIALFGYNYLVARVNSVMNLLEQKSMEFRD